MCNRNICGHFIGNFVIKKQSGNWALTSMILELFFSDQGLRATPILKGIKTIVIALVMSEYTSEGYPDIEGD